LALRNSHERRQDDEEKGLDGNWLRRERERRGGGRE